MTEQVEQQQQVSAKQDLDSTTSICCSENKRAPHDATERRPMIIFSPLLTKNLSAIRLAATYIGVKRIRPTSKEAFNGLRCLISKANTVKRRRLLVVNLPEEVEYSGENTTATEKGVVVFKVIGEDGKERRMTAKEKKDFKRKIALDKKNKKLTTTNEQLENSGLKQTNAIPSREAITCQNNQRRNYHQLPMREDFAAMEEELAFFEHCRVPPVVLSSSMVTPLLAQNHLLSTSYPQTIEESYVVDDQLAHTWATHIRKEIAIAEELRSREPIRPLAYNIIPEVWTRMRPSAASASATPTEYGGGENIDEDVTDLNINYQVISKSYHNVPPMSAISTIDDTNKKNDLFCFASMGKSNGDSHSNFIEDDHHIIFNQLHGPKFNLHISCGAKFGCDFLLYDGPREERHAFAGLRILHSSSSPSTATTAAGEVLPIATPYDLSGFVRGLNTAGKLALLATVLRDSSSNSGSLPAAAKIAFVDLALEKDLTAPTHKKKKQTTTQQKRKEMGRNLSKVKKKTL